MFYSEKDPRVSKHTENRINSRIPPEIENININSYIASLTDIAREPETQERCPETVKNLERTIRALSYMRNEHHVRTYGEALDVLRKRDVDPIIIDLWAEELMLTGGLNKAAIEGYPELKDKLKKAEIRLLKQIIPEIMPELAEKYGIHSQ
ncbi:MAG: hypothetical protein ACE5ES_05490 [Candidatus Nanoarchaeia archaeon]